MTKHGLSKTRAYTVWNAMRQRCENPKSKYFPYYGGRGIKICERWKLFANFFADMGEPETGMTLDRFPDQDGNYEAANCRWATRKEQQNNLRSNRKYSFWGHQRTIAEIAELVEIPRNTIDARLAKGMAIDDAVSREKLFDLSGLALGAAISSKARKARTHCKRGHEFTPENTGKQKAGRYCKRCDADRARAVSRSRR